MARLSIYPNIIRTAPKLVIALAGVILLASATAAQTPPDRALFLVTPLQADLSLTGFSGSEELSRLFRYELEIVSATSAIGAADIVGQNVTFSVLRADGSPRFFNGFVSRFTAGDFDDLGRRSYRAEVVPWLWFLTRTTDSRIFQNRTVPEIISLVARELGFGDLRSDLTATYRRNDCIVQYRESDFNFVSRLMEQVGISYYFVHEAGKHTLVLTDSLAGIDASPGCEILPYVPLVSSPAAPFQSSILSWEHRYRYTSGRVTQTDYNFMVPKADLLTTSSTAVDLPGIDRFELYDYPGKYTEIAIGEVLTGIRMEEEEVAHDVVAGMTNCRGFSPGHRFALSSHPSPGEAGTYVITSIHHTATEPAVYNSQDGLDPTVYSSRFTCIPFGVVFRPERTTPKPVISGVQTAVVVGPRGKSIHTDRYGRVKVQFHWDREGKSDEDSSCWIRVAHDYTKSGPTPAFIPRVGSEVVVSFLEGDPDRPLVIGRVHSANSGVFTGDDARSAPSSFRRKKVRPFIRRQRRR